MTPPSRVFRKTDEKALSEVIGFILLLGVIVAAFALWMVYIVPINGREAEISHMEAVKDRFTDYKISLDSLWINNQTGGGDLPGVTLSTSFGLGTGGGNTQAGGLFLPLINPIGSSATLSVKDYGDRMWINTSSRDPNGYVVNLTVLEYQSQNNYWIQQKYYYQTGGVFLSQDNGSIYRLSPPFTMKNISAGGPPYAWVILEPIQILGAGSSIGGNGPVRVDTSMYTPYNHLDNQNNFYVNISVNVTGQAAAQMWAGLFNDTLSRGQVVNGASWYTTKTVYVPATNRGYVFVNITGPTSNSNNIRLTYENADYLVTLNNIALPVT